VSFFVAAIGFVSLGAFPRSSLMEDNTITRDMATFGVERAAYALWRLNWIHPFAGGNGRTPPGY
jgi:fido (protein-threonine AMPylation protein)